VKVVVWLAVVVSKLVVRTVCKIVGAVLGFLRDFFVGLWGMLVGLVTWDCGRFYNGLMQLLGGVWTGVSLVRVGTLVDTLYYIGSEARRNQLKAYIRTKLGFKYSGQEFQDIVDNLRLDRGAFGYRIHMRAIRTYLDSETPSPTDPNIPNLVALHEDGKNVRELCGFEFDEGCTNRKRFKTLKKGLHAGGGGGEIDNPISSEELDIYLSSRGAEGPKFFVFSMRDGVLETKLRAAEVKGRELGLIPQWTHEDLEVLKPDHVIQSATSWPLVNFLVDAVKRKRKVHDPQDPSVIINMDEVLADLCTPVAVGVFRYQPKETRRGISACLMGSACEPALGEHEASGVSFIDNQPDEIWKYVPIHELGHYFGLCHVEGLERIMYTPKGDKGEDLSWWDTLKKSVTWWTVPELVILKGEPSFTLGEAMQVWDYIIEHFPPTCLGVKSRVIL
jgi:hypothetical protein